MSEEIHESVRDADGLDLTRYEGALLLEDFVPSPRSAALECGDGRTGKVRFRLAPAQGGFQLTFRIPTMPTDLGK